jgi:site-specific recombinase XerD
MPRKIPAGVPLASLLPSSELSLQESNRSPKTIASYTGTAHRFICYLKDNGLSDDAERVDAPHLRAFLLAEAERTSHASAAVHFRNLRVFFGWLEREGERTSPNPMARVDEPKVARKVKESLTTEQLAALLKACGGADFESRRDTAG